MNIIQFFIPHFCLPEIVTKICTVSGQWFLHPESNRMWTNYSRCNEHTIEGRVVGCPNNRTSILTEPRPLKTKICFLFSVQTAMNLFYLTLIGHGLSLISLLVSLAIFFHFKWVAHFGFVFICTTGCMKENQICFCLFFFWQKFKLPEDHPAQKPLPVICPKLCDHHHLADRSGQQPGAGSEEPGEFIPLHLHYYSFHPGCIEFGCKGLHFSPIRRAVKCPSLSICTCLAVITSGCCVRGSTCTRSSWWLCLLRSNTWCGIIC